MILITLPKNVTFTNNHFDNVIWENLYYGILTGYIGSVECPQTT
jgi:hypothetical protein